MKQYFVVLMLWNYSLWCDRYFPHATITRLNGHLPSEVLQTKRSASWDGYIGVRQISRTSKHGQLHDHLNDPRLRPGRLVEVVRISRRCFRSRHFVLCDVKQFHSYSMAKQTLKDKAESKENFPL